MVQEFHVLRCFSCQTFQVQQVKKSKKWTCTVCGERQSLIKEFGRGAAADCRRHVQKLNALRGQMLEVNSEQLLTQRNSKQAHHRRHVDTSHCMEPDENEDIHESLDQNPNSEQEVAHVSRWSKYTDQTAEGPTGHEDEEEDENVYTERHQFRGQGSRKRKTISSESFGGRDGNREDEESWTGCTGFKRRSYLVSHTRHFNTSTTDSSAKRQFKNKFNAKHILHLSQQDSRFKSSWSKGSASKYSSCGRSGDEEPCSSTNLPSSLQAVCYPSASGENKQRCNFSHKPPTAEVTKSPLRQSPPVSSHQKFGKTKIENKNSKWDKFLTVVTNQQDEEEYDYDCSGYTEALTDMGVDSEKCRYPLDEKTDSGALRRQKSVGDVCADGNVSSPNCRSSKPDTFEIAVCQQPTRTKMPCSGLFINSLFFTDEDFDDTF